MQTKGIELEDLTDLIALRVIVPEERHCYMALNVVHRIFEPDLLRFKDYIAKPKSNGYQSIHTSVLYQGGCALFRSSNPGLKACTNLPKTAMPLIGATGSCITSFPGPKVM